MEKEKKSKKKKIADSKMPREALELLHKSKMVPARQLTIDVDGRSLKEIDELSQLLDKKLEDPKEKYELFYNGIQRVLKKYLVLDKEGSRLIRDEMNIFLSRGHAKDKNGKRWADVRMGYNVDHQEVVKLISDWAVNSRDPVTLYTKIFELNEKHGYPHQYYDDTSDSFHKAMKRKLSSRKTVNK